MKFVIGVIILGIFLVGCRDAVHSEAQKLRQEVRIARLDRDVFSLDTLSFDWDALYRQYGRYFRVYAEGVLNLGDCSDAGFGSLFRLFVQDPVMREVADSVAAKYPEMGAQEEELAQAFAYYRYYFPGHVVPRVYAHISGFNQSVVVDSAAVGVSLDNYLGEKCVFYSMLAVPVPMYARKKMNASDISRDVVAGWLSTEFPFRPAKNDLVSGMIYQGKLVFGLQKLFPDKALHWLLGFTPEQEEWCWDNEEQIWGFLIGNDYLFSSEQRLIMKYLNDAPYTSGMPIESPGKTVVWTGVRIVEKYVKKTGVSLEELMREQDYHKLLRVAGYRP